jgi:hypothetical protein
VDELFIDVIPAPPGLTVDALTDTKLAGKARAAKTQKQRGNAIGVKVKVRAGERLTAKARGTIEVNPTSRAEAEKDRADHGRGEHAEAEAKESEGGADRRRLEAG